VIIVILDVVVVGLVKYTCGVVIAVWIFVSITTHLVNNLGLGCLCA